VRADRARYLELKFNETEWRRAWKRIGSARPDANMTFNTRAVSVVYWRRKKTGGYRVEMTGLRRAGAMLAMSVNERRPASGDVTTQAVTSPFVAVSCRATRRRERLVRRLGGHGNAATELQENCEVKREDTRGDAVRGIKDGPTRLGRGPSYKESEACL
jgi:hypothetical protein